MTTTTATGFQIPRLLLPKPGVDLQKWAVIACDQFTSEPEYWGEVARLVSDTPSTYHITLPEVYLDTPEEEARVRSIRDTMQDYLARDLFVEYEGLMLVERTVAGKTRHGLMLALDLEHYDYNKGSTSLIRATEGTILERIPPRVRIRSGAPLELPHILVLIDDPEQTVIEPLVAGRQRLRKLYDFDLMLGSGHLAGYFADDPALQQQVSAALARLADPAGFAHKYGLESKPVLLFAMGDGNHSLATAKAIWERIKGQVGMDHPARYALVEIENIHDTGLEFEPIHRVLFDVQRDFLTDSALLPRPLPTRALRQRADHDRPGESRDADANTLSGSSRRPAATWPTSPTHRATCRWARYRPSWTHGARPAASPRSTTCMAPTSPCVWDRSPATWGSICQPSPKTRFSRP